MPADTPSRWPARIMAVVTLAVVTGIAGLGWWRLQPPPATGAVRNERPQRAQRSPNDTTEPAFVEPDQDYYVHVRLIELRPNTPDGGSWDSRGGAPDIAFRLTWGGTPVFTGTEREDRLIGEWDLLSLDVKDAVLSGEVDLASAINAPLIQAKAGGVLTIEIWDEDVSFNDEAGRFDLLIDTLYEGLNTFEPAAGGVARIEMDLIPRDMPLPDLLERAGNR